jgi:ABC-type branched-subunit amino acid transport system substrate-binding protein
LFDTNRAWRLTAAIAVLAALVVAGCGSSASNSESGSSSTGSEKVTLPPVVPVSSPDCQDMVYRGEGKPDVLVPVQMAFLGFQKTINDASLGLIEKYLDQQQWKAGGYKVAIQACNDATTTAAFTDPAKCAQLASAYASNLSVVAVIGYDSSACLQTVAPTLNQAPGGGLAIVSTEATYVCFVAKSPSACKPDEPAKYYPNGKQNLFMALPPDNYTAAAFAQLAKDKGYKKLYVLSHNQAYGIGLASLAASAAKKSGISVAKQESWDPKAASYRALMERVKASGADALVVAGFPSDNAAQLMKDRAAVLGQGFPALMASPLLDKSFLDAMGPAGDGSFVLLETTPPDQLQGESKTFFDEYSKESKVDTSALGAYPTFAVATIQLTSQAIADSNGTRAGVLAAFPKVKVEDSVYGAPTGFTPTGALAPPPPAGYYAINGGKLKYEGEIGYPAQLASDAL